MKGGGRDLNSIISISKSFLSFRLFSSRLLVLDWLVLDLKEVLPYIFYWFHCFLSLPVSGSGGNFLWRCLAASHPPRPVALFN